MLTLMLDYVKASDWDTRTISLDFVPISLLFIFCDGAVLEIYLDLKFQWPQEGLNCESLAYEVVT